jgi:hypothetical protein
MRRIGVGVTESRALTYRARTLRIALPFMASSVA